MQKYISQLLSDIEYARVNLSLPFTEKQTDFLYWISDEEEERTAPVRNLQEWTGITAEMMPPAERLSSEQMNQVLEALKKLLDACNWSFVLQTRAPENIQYETIRQNFDQEVKIKQSHHGFFAVCKEDTTHKECSLGLYCQCAFYADLFSGFIDEDLTPEEERARELEIEISYLKKRYEDEWMKYYPYHLDKTYDDKNGNPYNYGIDDINEDEGDNWWRR